MRQYNLPSDPSELNGDKYEINNLKAEKRMFGIGTKIVNCNDMKENNVYYLQIRMVSKILLSILY